LFALRFEFNHVPKRLLMGFFSIYDSEFIHKPTNTITNGTKVT
jgi:hypothetical protein